MARSRRRAASSNQPPQTDPREALAQMLGDVVNACAAEGEDLRKQIRGRAKWVSQSLQQIQESEADVLEVIDRQVREQPVLTLLGAVGVGILLGRWMRGE